MNFYDSQLGMKYVLKLFSKENIRLKFLKIRQYFLRVIAPVSNMYHNS